MLQKFQRDVITDINERIMTQSDYLGIKIIDAKKLDTLLNGKFFEVEKGVLGQL